MLNLEAFKTSPDRSYSRTNVEGDLWRSLSLSHWVWELMVTWKLYILNLHILLLKVRENTFFKDQFGTGGISWNLLNHIFSNHVDYNLTFARVTHGNLMPQSPLGEPWWSLNIFLKIRLQLIPKLFRRKLFRSWDWTRNRSMFGEWFLQPKWWFRINQHVHLNHVYDFAPVNRISSF